MFVEALLETHGLATSVGLRRRHCATAADRFRQLANTGERCHGMASGDLPRAGDRLGQPPFIADLT